MNLDDVRGAAIPGGDGHACLADQKSVACIPADRHLHRRRGLFLIRPIDGEGPIPDHPVEIFQHVSIDGHRPLRLPQASEFPASASTSPDRRERSLDRTLHSRQDNIDRAVFDDDVAGDQSQPRLAHANVRPRPRGRT